MRSRRPRGRLLWFLLVAGTVAAVTPVDVLADVSDDPARAVVGAGSFVEQIDRPGDRDWYFVVGAPAGGHETIVLDAAVTVPNATCPAVAPLLLILHNPEGFWIRTIAIYPGEPAEHVYFPSFGDRYLVEMRAADAGCAGLEYRLLIEPIAPAADVAGSNALCRIARGQRVELERLVRFVRQQRERARSSGARRRHARELKRLKRNLSAAYAHQRKACRASR